MIRNALFLLSLLVLSVSLVDSACADSSWMPRWLGGKSDQVSTAKSKSTKATKPKTAASKSGSSNLFTNTKDLFSSKKKPKVVSKWPSERTNVSRKKEAKGEKKSWFSSMFSPEEPEPPRSVDEWMSLKQIKP